MDRDEYDNYDEEDMDIEYEDEDDNEEQNEEDHVEEEIVDDVNEDDDGIDRIPCEICNQTVTFEEYSDHLERCLTGEMLNPSSSVEAQVFILPQTGIPVIPSFLRTINLEQGLRSNDAHSMIGARLIQHMISGNEYEYNLLMQELMGGAIQSGVTDLNKAAPLCTDAIPSDEPCSICCELLGDGVQKQVRKTQCNHYFCDPCISKWFEKSRRCPNCTTEQNE